MFVNRKLKKDGKREEGGKIVSIVNLGKSTSLYQW